MVGLPARGKTYIAHKISRYMNWLGIHTRVFNVGEYRRKISGANQPSDFFDPNNRSTQQAKMQAASEALQDLVRWMVGPEDGQVSIYDATNSTLSRRVMVRMACEAAGIRVLFIESICNNRDLILTNIREVKLSCPDYHGADPEWATQDFKRRIAMYESAYETVDIRGDEQDVPF